MSVAPHLDFFSVGDKKIDGGSVVKVVVVVGVDSYQWEVAYINRTAFGPHMRFDPYEG